MSVKKVTGVSDQPEGSGVVWKCKDRCSDKGLNQDLEGCFLGWGPDELDLLSCKVE